MLLIVWILPCSASFLVSSIANCLNWNMSFYRAKGHAFVIKGASERSYCSRRYKLQTKYTSSQIWQEIFINTFAFIDWEFSPVLVRWVLRYLYFWIHFHSGACFDLHFYKSLMHRYILNDILHIQKFCCIIRECLLVLIADSVWGVIVSRRSNW